MIGVTSDGPVTTIELQRPERRNAVTYELALAFAEEVKKAAETARTIVVTGQGTSFCAGADLSSGAPDPDKFADAWQHSIKSVDAADIPVIAAVNGPAIGAGVMLAMVADLRVVSETARFQFPVAKYGIALDNWSIRRLTSLVGYGRARAMLLAAEPLDAQTALQTGMANRIGELADAQAWAAELAGFAPLALKHAKRVLNDDGAFEDQWPEHKELFDKAWGSQDIIEAQVARIQKRPPNFQGA